MHLIWTAVEERFAVFGISCGDAPPSFEAQECVFDEVAEFIQIFVGAYQEFCICEPY